jgi:hypothetical protein
MPKQPHISAAIPVLEGSTYSSYWSSLQVVSLASGKTHRPTIAERQGKQKGDAKVKWC